MTDTLEPAEFEPEDTSTPEPEPAEPDTPTDPPPERVGHMKWDAAKGVYVDPDPKHTREQRYRQQLRATETERDELRQRLDTRDTADVERTVQSKLTDPSDLWKHGVTLADLRDETGEIDPEKVDAAVLDCTSAHPHWATGAGFSRAAPASMVTSDGKPDPNAEQPTWQSVFQSALRQP